MAIQSIGSHTVFKLVAGKRGGRLGWKDAEGQKVYEQLIAHDREDGVICWHTADPDEVTTPERNGKSKKVKEDLMRLVPATGSILKSALISKAQTAEFGLNKARGFIDEYIEDGQLFEWHVKRSRKRDEIRVARTPQPDPELVLHGREQQPMNNVNNP